MATNYFKLTIVLLFISSRTVNFHYESQNSKENLIGVEKTGNSFPHFNLISWVNVLPDYCSVDNTNSSLFYSVSRMDTDKLYKILYLPFFSTNNSDTNNFNYGNIGNYELSPFER